MMSLMNGIRVNGIPPQHDIQLLLSYFESTVECKVDKSYYPLLNNDAVITFHDKFATLKILTIQDISIGATRFNVRPLPHQIFSEISVLVEEEVATLVLATDEYKDTLIQNGVKMFTTKSNGLGFKGQWFELEWAWNYLHGILEYQYHIQEELRRSLYASSNPVKKTVNERETTENNSVSRLEEPNPGLAKSVNASRHTSVKNHSPVANRIVDSNVSSPRRFIGSSRDSTISKSPSSSLGAVGGHSEGTMRQTKVSEPQYENHSSQIRNPVTDSMKSLHSSNDIVHSPSDEPVVTLSDVSTRDRKHAARMSRSEDADTFEYLASMRRNPTIDSGNDPFSSLLTQLHGLSTSGSSTDTEAKRSTAVSNEQVKSHFTRYSLHTEANETPASISSTPNSQHTIRFNTRSKDTSASLGSMTKSQHTTKSSTDARPKDTSASLHENVENSQHSARSISDTGSSSKSKSLHRSMSLTDFQFTLLNEIEVSVYYGSLVKAKVDCIVNAANNALQHYSGVARAIEKAAGPELKDDCEAFIKRNTELPLTCVMHTRAGGQLKHLKYVIHTVGPVYYKKRQDSCIELLTRTFYNCIKYADENIFMKSLALPFISTGVFDVPLECCVEAFLDAVVLFASEKREVLCLHKIHFVNTDADSVCTAIVMLQQRLEKPFSDLLKDARAKTQAVLSSEPRFGYPDPGYLKRVKEELAVKRITK